MYFLLTERIPVCKKRRVACKTTRCSHLVKLLVDGRNVFQVCDELPHHGAICEREDLRILRRQGEDKQLAGRHAHTRRHAQGLYCKGCKAYDGFHQPYAEKQGEPLSTKEERKLDCVAGLAGLFPLILFEKG